MSFTPIRATKRSRYSRVSDQQAARLRPWAQNMRRLDTLLKKLQELGLRAAQAVPPS